MAKKQTDAVRVRIQARQVVSYDQIIEMPRADYNELVRRWEDDENFGRQNCDEDLGGWLELSDNDSAGDVEDVDIFEVDEKGRKKKQPTA